MYETWTEAMNILRTGKIDLGSFVAKKRKLDEFDKAVEEFSSYSGRIVFEHGQS